MNTRERASILRLLVLSGLAALVGCDKPKSSGAETHGSASGAANPSPTNRVDIPTAVRTNLGITFAKVEYRNVAQTLRVPGQFELLPTARREYRTPMPGRIELMVTQFQRVEAGTPLYGVDSSVWRDLHEQITAMQARVDSMGPLREAHRIHETSLGDKVQLWKERLTQLEQLRIAGGGSGAQFTEARATLNATQAELAEVKEKEASLEAEQRVAEAELRSLQSRRQLLINAASGVATPTASSFSDTYMVRAIGPGIVETIEVTTGGVAEESALIVTVVQPEQIRFRARGLQSDLGRLRDGLAARIAPAQGGSVELQDVMTGTLQLGLTADADERTVDLIVLPQTLSNWARAGVAAHLEITLSGGNDELSIPSSAVVRDGATPIIFRRDPANPDKAIRMEADVGISDGRWTVINSGVKAGDEIVLGGNYQLMLATSGTAAKGGHFHPDGTFHEGAH